MTDTELADKLACLFQRYRDGGLGDDELRRLRQLAAEAKRRGLTPENDPLQAHRDLLGKLSMSKPSLADQCEKLLRLFLDAPEDGYTLEEIAKNLGWSYRDTGETVLALGGRVGYNVVRAKGNKVTRYFLKRRA